jgi:ribonuclease P protein subunit POP4
MRKREVVKAEFIGSDVEIIESKNKSLIGLKGKIVDETRNMFIVKCKEKMKKILKDQVRLKIDLPEGEIEVDGKLLVGRPEDRLKK